ncbi:MAG TPA: hypothetical protein PLG85_09110 [Cyclobacteriaceae bacterium]|nr:hypothetical protein [Cyclobacteriaceae bacterium]
MSFKISLADDRFSQDETKEILLHLIYANIQFHQLKNFSSEERFGESHMESIECIEQLRLFSKQILKTIETASGKSELAIDLRLVVEIKAKQKYETLATRRAG